MSNLKDKKLKRLTIDIDEKLHLMGSLLFQTEGMAFSKFAKDVVEEAIREKLEASPKKEAITSLVNC